MSSFLARASLSASSIVINVINSFASKYGLESEKGTILGIFRSLQALARATGPLLASFGKRTPFAARPVDGSL